MAGYMDTPNGGPMSEWVSLGTWVGLDADGVVQAGCVVTDANGEAEARKFVTAGSRTVMRVGPEVRVRLGSPLPETEGDR